MLLPPAFPCEMYATYPPQRPQRPKLPSFGPYESVLPSTQPGPGGLLASCRALQTILGGSVHSSTEPVSPRTIPQTNPFDVRHELQPPPSVIVSPPRNMNKRGRDEYDEDDLTPMDGIQTSIEDRPIFQTPKRQRRIPIDLPLGLEEADFDGLVTPALPQAADAMDEDRPHSFCEDAIVPIYYSSPSEALSSKQPLENIDENIEWSPGEDQKLIETVLCKLNMSVRDWNDCAKELGQDSSLGRRWRTLIGEGNMAALRRGSGQMQRTGLDIESW